jgi:hypothetical protein
MSKESTIKISKHKKRRKIKMSKVEMSKVKMLKRKMTKGNNIERQKFRK